MAKKRKIDDPTDLWDGIDINADFQEGLTTAEDVQLDQYNTEKMTIFSANINYARQLPRISDSLKPVQRRILLTMYKKGLRTGKKEKSISVSGAVTTIHPHGGASVYATMIGMAQYWKMAMPLIRVFGSYGNEVSSTYAADRYTEVSLSEYAYNCFFKDYDEECVQTIFSTTGQCYEAVSLPSRYPNVLINGGMGIAVGNAYRIPPFNLEETIKATKQVLRDGPSVTKPIYLAPDFPTGCMIIDTDNSVKQICETGKGKIRLRAKTTIEDLGKHWAIRITNLPWGVSMDTLVKSLADLVKAGVLPIKDVQDRHKKLRYPDGTVKAPVDLWVIIDKAHDPYQVREGLFTKTKLEETLPIDFNGVLDLELVRYPLRPLIQAWIDTRREYKRRLINKKISKISADIELLKILIEVMSGKNLEKTVTIIKGATEERIVDDLVSMYGMSSYQAERISSMALRAFNKNAPEKYKKELAEKEDELKYYMKLVRSEKDIDDIISLELDELKKYFIPRQSEIVNTVTGQTMDIDTEYFVFVTNKSNTKKVSVATVEKTRKGFGTFGADEYITKLIRGTNLDTIIMTDSFGKFSILNIGDLPSMAVQDPPANNYTLTKLEGSIISMELFQNQESIDIIREMHIADMYYISITEDGLIKKTSAVDLVNDTDNGRKGTRNACMHKLRPNDTMAHAGYYLNDANMIIYTKRGEFTYSNSRMVSEFGRTAQGTQYIRVSDGDAVQGCCIVPADSKYIVVVTARGFVKKCEIEFLGKPSPSKHATYLATLDDNDSVIYVGAPLHAIEVCTTLGVHEYHLDDIKTLARRAKPIKKVPLPQGDRIIRVNIN